MKVQFRIALVCGFGALIGTSVALYLRSSLSWVGLITAAVFGYLAHDFRDVAAVIRSTVAKEVARETGLTLNEFWARLRLASVIGVCFSVFTFNLTLIPAALIAILIFLDLLPNLNTAITAITASQSLATLFGFAAAVCTFVGTLYTIVGGPVAVIVYMRKKPPLTVSEELGAINLRSLLRWNVLTFYGFWIWYGLYQLVGMKIVARVFVGIHSDLCFVCACDAPIGMASGYYFAGSSMGMTASLITGFIAGALCGVLNYEIVSKRILKLVPIAN